MIRQILLAKGQMLDRPNSFVRLQFQDSIDQVESLATNADRTFVVFRGVIYNKQPVFLTTVSYLWSMSLRRLSLVSQIPPVMAVVSSCDAERLPWDTLRFI